VEENFIMLMIWLRIPTQFSLQKSQNILNEMIYIGELIFLIASFIQEFSGCQLFTNYTIVDYDHEVGTVFSKRY